MALLPHSADLEHERLTRLRDLVVLDTPPEPLFDSLARLASQVCGAPIALVSLIDAERQWFKANVGLPGVNETPRDVAFCAHAIESDVLFEIPDATLDPRFADNPLVTGAPDIRFYAGAPLVMPDGHRVGTLCVIDREARRLDAAQAAMLRSLAAIASQALVMRQDLIRKSLTVRGEYERSLAESEAQQRAQNLIFAHTPDYVMQTDAQGHVTSMNASVRRALGIAPDAPVDGLDFNQFNTPATQQLFAQTIVPAVHKHGMWLGETTVYVGGRREIPVSHMVIAHRDPSGRIERYSSVMRDISGEVEAKRQLRRQTATLQSITEAIPALISVVGVDGRYRFVNSAFERWIGAPRDRIVGRTRAEVVGHADDEHSQPWAQRALAGESVSFERDYTDRHGTRHLALSYIPLWLEDGTVDGYVTVGQDITHHKREEGRLLQLAQRDALTGLLNRAGFEQVAEHAMKNGDGPQLAVLYVDLDHFKPVNDRHGHPVGDQVLQMFGARLRSLVRPSDAVARLGGDEFALLLSGVRLPENAHMVAQKVVEAAREPFVVGELALQVGASVGVAYGADRHGGWRAMVEHADRLLYKAKQAGRGRVGEPTRL